MPWYAYILFLAAYTIGIRNGRTREAHNRRRHKAFKILEKLANEGEDDGNT